VNIKSKCAAICDRHKKVKEKNKRARKKPTEKEQKNFAEENFQFFALHFIAL
jgi:hypothetical protein